MRRFLRYAIAITVGIAAVVTPALTGPAAAAAQLIWPVEPAGKCLDADNATPRHDGTKVQLWACADAEPQRWSLYHVCQCAEEYYVITKGSYCLDADRQTINSNGTLVHLWTCGRNASNFGYELNQVWYLWRSGPNTLLVNGQSRRCLDADRATWDRPSTKIHLWDCAPGAPGQDWYIPA